MAPLVSTIEINRPQDEVFAYVTDPSTFVEWQEGVVGGGMEGGRTPALGSKCTTTRRIGGSQRPSTSEVTKLGSAHELGRSRDRRPDQSDRQRHRRAAQWERPVARHDRARIRGTRHRQAASATRCPQTGKQRDASKRAEAQATPRGESGLPRRLNSEASSRIDRMHGASRVLMDGRPTGMSRSLAGSSGCSTRRRCRPLRRWTASV
jgi:hypothetical protein